MKKAQYYYELGAMKGNAYARHCVGLVEEDIGNTDRALKHWMIAVGGGYKNSLKKIQYLFEDGHVTKEDYTRALRSYQEYLGEIKSAQRDEASAASEEYLCY